MKINLPGHRSRQPFPKEGRPFQKTIFKGSITIQRMHLLSSALHREELVGKNHNMVRHPDMPPEAFADLWQTIKKNAPGAHVKNRCKTVTNYWVDAMGGVDPRKRREPSATCR